MILTGTEIATGVRRGTIVLDPFSDDMLNPNSYNYRLGSTLLESTATLLDAATSAGESWAAREISPAGFVLQPQRLYLATTLEVIGSERYVPLLIGRSSIGRLGLFLQISADLGQLGAIHRWTLELVATQAIRVYPGMRIGQVSFWEPTGDISPYSGYFGTKSDPTSTPGGYARDDSNWQ